MDAEDIRALARTWLREQQTEGDPNSPANNPSKSEGRLVFDELADFLTTLTVGGVSGIRPYDTLAAATADIANIPNGGGAWVVDDGTPANNGLYRNNAGSLVQVSDFDLGAVAADAAAAVLRNGSRSLTGNLSAGGNKLTNLAAGTGVGNSVRWEQVLMRDGSSGAMTTFLDMGPDPGNDIILRKAPTSPAHAANKSYVDAQDTVIDNARIAGDNTVLGAVIKRDGSNAPTSNMNWGGFIIQSMGAGSANGHSVRYEQVMLRNGALAATANLPMGGFKMTGLAAGSASGDSARYDELNALSTSVSAAALIADRVDRDQDWALYETFPTIMIIGDSLAETNHKGTKPYTYIGQCGEGEITAALMLNRLATMPIWSDLTTWTDNPTSPDDLTGFPYYNGFNVSKSGMTAREMRSGASNIRFAAALSRGASLVVLALITNDVAQALYYTSKALMDANTSATDGTRAQVTADGANNGVYSSTGGVWTRLASPYNLTTTTHRDVILGDITYLADQIRLQGSKLLIIDMGPWTSTGSGSITLGDPKRTLRNQLNADLDAYAVGKFGVRVSHRSALGDADGVPLDPNYMRDHIHLSYFGHATRAPNNTAHLQALLGSRRALPTYFRGNLAPNAGFATLTGGAIGNLPPPAPQVPPDGPIPSTVTGNVPASCRVTCSSAHVSVSMFADPNSETAGNMPRLTITTDGLGSDVEYVEFDVEGVVVSSYANKGIGAYAKVVTSLPAGDPVFRFARLTIFDVNGVLTDSNVASAGDPGSGIPYEGQISYQLPFTYTHVAPPRKLSGTPPNITARITINLVGNNGTPQNTIINIKELWIGQMRDPRVTHAATIAGGTEWTV